MASGSLGLSCMRRRIPRGLDMGPGRNFTENLGTPCRDGDRPVDASARRIGTEQEPRARSATMRFMVMIKAGEQVGPPPAELMDVMNKRMSELMGSGVMLDAGGLLPSHAGARVRLSGGRVATIDGPFTEAKELVGAYSIIQVASKQEALDLTTEVIQIHKDHWP